MIPDVPEAVKAYHNSHEPESERVLIADWAFDPRLHCDICRERYRGVSTAIPDQVQEHQRFPAIKSIDQLVRDAHSEGHAAGVADGRRLNEHDIKALHEYAGKLEDLISEMIVAHGGWPKGLTSRAKELGINPLEDWD